MVLGCILSNLSLVGCNFNCVVLPLGTGMLLLVSAIYWCLSYGVPLSKYQHPAMIKSYNPEMQLNAIKNEHDSIYRSSHIDKHPNPSNQILRQSRIAMERLPEEKTGTPPTKTTRTTNG
ncbi:hypothetical protein BDV33DRAFT_168434 [Aspergillus novoparasiticus]|uniref:Uncharacterized protein n=1 Tax=Aspergillus novoparasiticus TaxID=986946 RepID=A0A5N6F059_9EURO|nr:hypothetical protein BDV33DRAFT_168434 [Aspergillus novoparasiticus]